MRSLKYEESNTYYFSTPFFSSSKIANNYVALLWMKIRNVIKVKHQLKFKQKKETNIGKSILNNVHLIISRIEIVCETSFIHDLAPNF